MLVKPLAKQALRRLAPVTHKLGCDSRRFGPPPGQASPQELSQEAKAKLTLLPLWNETTIKRRLPNTIEAEIHPKFYCDIERKAPACYVAELEQGRTVRAHGVVISASDHIVQDLAPVIGSGTLNHKELYTRSYALTG